MICYNASLTKAYKTVKTTIPFHKMVASGNDFIVVDNRRRVIKNPLQFTREMCRSHTGIGADGILLFENSTKADFKMRILNADGSEAEACGNGFRCIALYAREILNYPAHLRFESLSGLIQADVQTDRVRVRLAEPRDYRSRGEVEVLGHRLHYSFLNTGVPHVVIFVEGLSKIDVEGLGRAIRRHPDFQPKGTNVNFAEVKSRSEIDVRTYERGVENETQACGTGSTASAIVSSLAGYTVPPVKVHTRGGEILEIDFKRNGNKISHVFLTGQARIVFEGKLA